MGTASKALAGKSDGKSISEMVKNLSFNYFHTIKILPKNL
jgi:hypothetical protein